jgi:hypothetical protein
MDWGAAVCSYIDALENQDISVELKALYESKPFEGKSQ